MDQGVVRGLAALAEAWGKGGGGPAPLTRAPPHSCLANHGAAPAALRPQLPTRHSMLRFIIASQEAGIQKEILLTSDKLWRACLLWLPPSRWSGWGKSPRKRHAPSPSTSRGEMLRIFDKTGGRRRSLSPLPPPRSPALKVSRTSPPIRWSPYLCTWCLQPPASSCQRPFSLDASSSCLTPMETMYEENDKRQNNDYANTYTVPIYPKFPVDIKFKIACYLNSWMIDISSGKIVNERCNTYTPNIYEVTTI